MAQKPVTKKEIAELNKAVRALRNFCLSRYACAGCPFKKDGISLYGVPCKFGSFYPELWDDVEVKEATN